MIILDGGIGQELLHRSGDTPTPLWATEVMLKHPGLVQEVHAAFFAAGAQVATANTYNLHHDRLAGTGWEDKFPLLLDRAMTEVTAARDAHGSGRIAGSLGPLVQSYWPEACPDPDVAAPLYAEIAGHIAPRCDLLIAETVSSVKQAEGTFAGIADAGLPLWLSVSVDDDNGRLLRSGEPISALQPVIDRYAPQAVLANCSAPEAMEAALTELARFGLDYGCYANGFAQITRAYVEDRLTTDLLGQRPDITPQVYADFAGRWADMGASIVGGCCNIGPDHIAALARRFGGAP